MVSGCSAVVGHMTHNLDVIVLNPAQYFFTSHSLSAQYTHNWLKSSFVEMPQNPSA